MPDLAGKTVAVIGGGIGGLTAALAFARYGAVVTVHEQAAALTEVGAGLQITPNGARVLDALGLWSDTSDVCIVAQAVVPTDGVTGRPIARFDLSSQNPAYRFMHRAALIDVLAGACRAAGVHIALGTQITAQGAQDMAADLCVFADGLKSVGRAGITGSASPFFTGQVAWRAVVDQEDAPEARIWMLPGRHVVTYPLPGGLLNVVAVQERTTWASEGWHQPDDPAHLRAAFADAAPALGAILENVEATHLWGLFRHEVASTWARDGCVLVGDAAHPTLPFLAQGANLAIEDGYVLAQSVRQAATIEEGLTAYQTARHPRVRRAIDAANANARNYHLVGMRRRIAHAGLGVLGKVAPNAFLGRLSWLYDHDVTQQG